MSKKIETTKDKPTQTKDQVPLPAWWQTARESFSGRLLTNRQFADAIAVTEILEREIRNTGAFKEKLADYAHAMARTERFDATKAETIIRDLFRERTGQTMNQLRERLAEREEKLGPAEKARALTQVLAIPGIVEVGDKLTFNRVLAAQAEDYADSQGITQAKARSLMAEAFEKAEGKSLYDWGKELDQQHYTAQVEAERAERATFVESDRSGDAPARPRGRVRNGPSL